MENVTNTTGNQAKPADNSTTGGNILVENPLFCGVSIKELLAKQDVQDAIRRYLKIPEVVTIKTVNSPFRNKETKIKTQKLEVASGKTIEDAAFFELTLVDTELEPEKAIGKKYRIAEYKLALIANMSGGKFGGYAAKGLKLMVTRLEEVK